MTRVRAIWNILLGNPTLYRVRFHDTANLYEDEGLRIVASNVSLPSGTSSETDSLSCTGTQEANAHTGGGETDPTA